MMKRNWPLIIAILGAIVAYDQFVLKPDRDRIAQIKKEKVAKETAAKEKAAQSQLQTQLQTQTTSRASGSGSLTQGGSGGDGMAAVGSTADLASARESVGKDESFSNNHFTENRSLRILENGAVSNLVFEKYTVRGEDNAQIVTMLEPGLRWSSNNPAVKQCLLSMQQQSGGMTFWAENSSLECRLQLQFDGEKSVLNQQLFLKPKVQLMGDVFLVAHDRLERSKSSYQADYDNNHIGYKMDEDIEHVRGDDLFEKKTIRGQLEWMSWGDRYFMMTLIPRGVMNPDVFYEKSAEVDKAVRFGAVYPLENRIEGTNYILDTYLGTTDLAALNSVQKGLDEVVDLGWFGSIARMMLWLLKKLNLLFHNYGVSIIVLTLLVRLAFWPLNKKVFESGQRMKEIQPKMEAIKKKYGNDRAQAAQMQSEIMALYRTEKVNPLGSCLPLLLQMPIFFALYGALQNSIDLYQAPFMFWIEDLSFKDPFYVLPVLWTGFLLLTMNMTPQMQTQPGMPNMKWIMMGMYVLFGFMFRDMPSGLTLYLVVSTLVGIIQQWGFRKKKNSSEVVANGAAGA